MIDNKVLNAFGIKEEGKHLAGGQNEAMLFGKIVLKPVYDHAYYSKVCQIWDALHPVEYRISRPHKTLTSDYVAYGYGATMFEPGFDDDTAIKEKLQAAKALNRDLKALGDVQLDESDDQWTRANNVLWQNRSIPESWADELKAFFNERLEQLVPCNEEHQLVHADLGGNILFHDTMKPLIIDFSPTIAPAKYAEAIIVCDSIAWAGQDIKNIYLLGDLNIYKPFIQRAILFRVLTVGFAEGRSIEDVIGEWQSFKEIWAYIG